MNIKLVCAAFGMVVALAVTAAAQPLRNAPMQVKVDGKMLSLSAEAWRDLMPIIVPDGATPPRGGRPLIADLTLKTTDGQALPKVKALAVTLFSAGRKWSGAPGEVRRTAGASSMEVLVRNGPKWAVGAKVDAVLTLRTPRGFTRSVRAPQTTIQAVY